MSKNYLISKANWDQNLYNIISDYDIYAPLLTDGNQDYQIIQKENINRIIYNTPKPTTPLKTFFLPVKENVALEKTWFKSRIIMGIPSCDLAAVGILDEIYLTEPYSDIYYKKRRDNTILLGTDCFAFLENCHCTTYGINPYPERHHDISLALVDEEIYLTIHSEKGEALLKKTDHQGFAREISIKEFEKVLEKRKDIKAQLENRNKHLPEYSKTGELLKNAKDSIWEKYAKTCVSCGACATICPTCTCFLLIDRPGFEKVRQLDACQYPAFERVAAGEDPLAKKHIRFRNRYLCKYLWKPEKFESVACTGCGRCIEACIGNINKNELFLELTT
jgi:sulfhydrogenase subunit beta (sulfur reductase)